MAQMEVGENLLLSFFLLRIVKVLANKSGMDLSLGRACIELQELRELQPPSYYLGSFSTQMMRHPDTSNVMLHPTGYHRPPFGFPPSTFTVA
ncbi:hypothetical protein CLCR_03213 [Cladophialophora carrionii]|uniref:Uncharacterized protein n=1 Tax=Cladophialophora carrionii TaxID=86049 RepID=A0A1C1D304_9EURO|nr:hypothetical protein CLCR_03213 [Cladophialophora carrionii]